MDDDDLPLKKDSPLTSVEKEDLSEWSAFELKARIQVLECEIERTKTEIKAKEGSWAVAEAFFKS